MIHLSSNLITADMLPLMAAFALDDYVVVVAGFNYVQAGLFPGLGSSRRRTGLLMVLQHLF
jgi:hypothetical protein